MSVIVFVVIDNRTPLWRCFGPQSVCVSVSRPHTGSEAFGGDSNVDMLGKGTVRSY